VCVGGWGWGGGFPLRSNIPRSALCATLDTYNFIYLYYLPTLLCHFYMYAYDSIYV
jgi:hypothetical protein